MKNISISTFIVTSLPAAYAGVRQNNIVTGVIMKRVTQIIIALCILAGNLSLLYASDSLPWGVAEILDIKYEPNKVLYDLTSGDIKYFSNVLNRIVYLNKFYESDVFESSIVIIVHGDAIPFFAISEFKKYRDIMARAQSLTVGTSIEFRMCRAAAKLLNYEPSDIHGFVKMVPMADAEIIRLQHESYAYMR